MNKIIKNSYFENTAYKVLLLCLSFSFCLNAQQKKIDQPKGSLKIDACLPNTVANYSFNRINNGLGDLAAYYQYNVYKGLTVGGGIRYTYFQVNQFSFSQSNLRGGLHIPAAFLKVGFEKFSNERFAYEWSLSSGYSYSISSNDSTKVRLGGAYTDESIFVQPKLGLYLIADGNVAFSMILSYTWLLNSYGPQHFGMDTFDGLGTGMTPSDWAGVTQFFSIGFGYSYYFGRK